MLRKDGPRRDMWTSAAESAIDDGKLSASRRSIAIHRRNGRTASKALFAAIVEYSSDSIIGFSKDLLITSWNPAAERLYGYWAAPEAIGRGFESVRTTDQLPQALAADERPLETRELAQH